MDSGTDEHSFLGQSLCTLRIFVFARNRQVVAPISCQSSRKYTFVVKVRGIRRFLNDIQVLLQITVSVRETMSEEDIIVSVLKRMGECKGVVCPEEATLVPFVWILVVIYALTDSVPSNSLLFFSLIRKAQYFHTVVVEGIRLREVQHIESHFLSRVSIGAPEEVPLSVTISVDVVL